MLRAHSKPTTTNSMSIFLTWGQTPNLNINDVEPSRLIESLVNLVNGVFTGQSRSMSRPTSWGKFDWLCPRDTGGVRWTYARVGSLLPLGILDWHPMGELKLESQQLLASAQSESADNSHLPPPRLASPFPGCAAALYTLALLSMLLALAIPSLTTQWLTCLSASPDAIANRHSVVVARLRLRKRRNRQYNHTRESRVETEDEMKIEELSPIL
nr:hypothetical protein Iba_chr13eCG7110 [Ipomoea batatas]